MIKSITEILEEIKSTKGTNTKKAILEEYKGNGLLKRYLKYTLDPNYHSNIVKIPVVFDEDRTLTFNTEQDIWDSFTATFQRCMMRQITGNNARDQFFEVFRNSSAEQEVWMRKCLKKNLGIGISTSTINKVIPDLIFTFEVSLAHKFDLNRIPSRSEMIGIEPKLDGIRCLAIKRGDDIKLHTRSGKLIKNFDGTVGKELSHFPDGAYDGEIMGKDFTELMRQVNRKNDIDVSDTYFAMFDYLLLNEWDSRNCTHVAFERYQSLCFFFDCLKPKPNSSGVSLNYLRVVPRREAPIDYGIVCLYHDEYVSQGFEGAMIKDLNGMYCFGRDYSVMKFKAFFDADVRIIGFNEGTGKHVGKLGSFQVDYKGVKVQVGSGLNDELREAIWANKNNYIGRTIEVRYQEETPDGSLRFPTFVCFRNDKEV